MASSWGFGGLSWTELGKRVWSEMQEDEILGRSAQLAYYFLLALFPLLLFLTSVIGIMLGSGTGLRHSLFNYLSQVLPGDAFKLIDSTMREVSDSSGGGKISFGILAALWAASNGMGAISESLNVAYEVKETRPWWKTRLVAIMLTVALALLIISALVLVLYGGKIAEHLAGNFGLGDTFTIAWKILQWPIALAFVLLAFALIYYLAPDLHDQDWKWVTPGSVIGVVLWLLVSFAFKAYLSFFNSYSATYGSLGAVIILMLWFYFTGAAILVGGEVNSEVENAMALQGQPDAKEKGEKSPDEKDGRATGKAAKPRGGGSTTKQTTRNTQTARAGGSGKKKNTAVAQARSSQPARYDGRKQRLSVGKIVVVFGAWALSKLRGGSPKSGKH